jgi:hypothetical protein
MKGFYDKIIPDFLNKYGKKWGAKVGEATIEKTEHGIAHKRYAILNREGAIAGQYPTRTEAEQAAAVRNAEGRSVGPFTVEDSFPGKEVPTQAISITPTMKESVLHEGQPLFQPSSNPGRRDEAAVAGQMRFSVEKPAGLPSYIRIDNYARNLISKVLNFRFMGAALDPARIPSLTTKLRGMAERVTELDQASRAQADGLGRRHR